MKRAFTVRFDDGGNIDLDMSAAFEAESSLMKADVLQAAIETLQAIYVTACESAFLGEQEPDREKRP